MSYRDELNNSVKIDDLKNSFNSKTSRQKLINWLTCFRPKKSVKRLTFELEKEMLELRAENDIRRERTTYLWDKVRAFYRMRRFFKMIEQKQQEKSQNELKGISKKYEIIELTKYLKNMEKGKDFNNWKCFISYDSPTYKFWIMVGGMFMYMQQYLSIYFIATNFLILHQYEFNNIMLILIVYNIMDIYFNLTCERIVDVVKITSLKRSAMVYISSGWLLLDCLNIIAQIIVYKHTNQSPGVQKYKIADKVKELKPLLLMDFN